MKSLKKLFSKGSVPDKNSKVKPLTEETARPTTTRGIKALCNSLDICLDDLYRAISGNTASDIEGGKLKIRVTSWVIYYKQEGNCCYTNVGSIAGATSDTIHEGTVIETETGKPWTTGSRRLDCSRTSEIWRNGPIGPFKYDFPEVVSLVEGQGYELMQNWFQGSATYLLQKIRVDGDLKVVWKLPLSKDDKVEGLSFVDTNTGEIYVLHFDQSKQSVKIDPEP